MKNPAETFLTATERQQVEARIAAAEKRTSGEIVVNIVPSSYHYPLAAMQGSLLLALIVGIALALFIPEETVWFIFSFFGLSLFTSHHTELLWFFLGIFGSLFIALHELIKHSITLKHLFVRKADMQEEVEEAAISAFYQHNLSNTEHHTGVLIYISLFERRVRVVADKGINEKVPQETWRAIVQLITTGIKTKHHAQALMTAIDRCGDILSAHFPIKPDDRNELSDAVIMGKRR